MKVIADGAYRFFWGVGVIGTCEYGDRDFVDTIGKRRYVAPVLGRGIACERRHLCAAE
jgi:hypothetical protein